MKKVRVALQDVLDVLKILQENGCMDVIVFEYEGSPAIVDADNPDGIIKFQSADEDEDDLADMDVGSDTKH